MRTDCHRRGDPTALELLTRVEAGSPSFIFA